MNLQDPSDEQLIQMALKAEEKMDALVDRYLEESSRMPTKAYHNAWDRIFVERGRIDREIARRAEEANSSDRFPGEDPGPVPSDTDLVVGPDREES